MSVSTRSLQNVTVTLDKDTFAKARVRAAERNMSLSRYVGEILRKDLLRSREYEEAMQRFLAEKPVRLKKPGERYPKREELYDRSRIR